MCGNYWENTLHGQVSVARWPSHFKFTQASALSVPWCQASKTIRDSLKSLNFLGKQLVFPMRSQVPQPDKPMTPLFLSCILGPKRPICQLLHACCTHQNYDILKVSFNSVGGNPKKFHFSILKKRIFKRLVKINCFRK